MNLILILILFVLPGCTPVFSQSQIELKPWGDSYDQPIAMIPWMQDDFILIEKGGKVKTIDENGHEQAVVLDISDHIAIEGGERGLLGVALHPGYPDTPYIYLNHTDEQNNTAVVRYIFDPESSKIDPKTRKIILQVDQPYSNHNGGCIVFDPDGYLYIGMGDGGSGGDPENRAQNLNSLLGKMLRIDVDSGDPYGIPEDNPFRDQDNAQPEIWSYGWRNPWRFSFDRMTGDMWVGDVGQNKVEEISFEPTSARGGLNYGWRCYEGDQPYKLSDDCDGPFVEPVITRTHEEGDRSITGGYRYRGPAPVLQNRYFFADYGSGNIYMAILDDAGEGIPDVDSLLIVDDKRGIASFAEDREGNLYVISLNGKIYKIFLTCDSMAVPELTEQSTNGDSIGLVTDGAYDQYIWHYSQDSDQKTDFSTLDMTENSIFYTTEPGNYYVTVVDQNGCITDSPIHSLTLSSTKAIDFFDIRLYPNPVSDEVFIETNKVIPDVRIEIINSQGQLVRKDEISLPGSVSLQNAPSGVYFLKFMTGQKYFMTKIIKQ